MKIAFAFLALCAVASAFVPQSPARSIVARGPVAARRQVKSSAMSMSLESMMTPETAESLSQFATTVTVASSSADFGGLAGPVAGLGFIVGLIVFLSPPLAD